MIRDIGRGQSPVPDAEAGLEPLNFIAARTLFKSRPHSRFHRIVTIT